MYSTPIEGVPLTVQRHCHAFDRSEYFVARNYPSWMADSD